MSGSFRFFGELQRRNVFRVALLYVIAAWVIVQVAETVLPMFDVPDAALRAVVIILALGFPLALVFAWVFELTPEGLRLEKDVEVSPETKQQTVRKLDLATLTVALLAIGLLIADRLLPEQAPAPRNETIADPGDPATEEPVATTGATTIAVLPFANLSAEDENAYFADGLSEEILNWLSRVPGLQVAGRTSSFYFKDQDADLATIGERLGVVHVLDGSVRRSGNRLRISAQLIEVDGGFQLWSDAWDRELDDIFAIQEEIARAIVDALSLELGADVSASTRTEIVPAYEKLLEARTLIARRGERGLRRAVALLEEAVRLDPTFAPAWGALGQAHSLVHYYDQESEQDRLASLARAETAAGRALALDPDLSSAHQVMGDVLRDRYRWQEAEASYRRALEINPNDVEANSQYGQMLSRLGLPARALPYIEKAAEIDPLAAIPPTMLGHLLVQLGDDEPGLAEMRRARSLAPELSVTLAASIIVHVGLGRINEAIELQREAESMLRETAPEDPLVGFAAILEEHGNESEASLTYLRGFRPDDFSRPFSAAANLWAAHLGDVDLSMTLLRAQQRNETVHDSTWVWTPGLVETRGLPGFAEYVADLRMPAYWREHGWPADCRTLGDDGLECGLGFTER